MDDKDRKTAANAAGGDGSGQMDPKIDQQVQLQIGERLRRLYDDVLEEPVPDRFKELLEQLRQSKSKKKN